jgi:hypothetical protein
LKSGSKGKVEVQDLIDRDRKLKAGCIVKVAYVLSDPELELKSIFFYNLGFNGNSGFKVIGF